MKFAVRHEGLTKPFASSSLSPFGARRPRPFTLPRTPGAERRDRLSAIEAGRDDARARIHAAFARPQHRKAASSLPAIFGGAFVLLVLLYILLS